MNFADHPETVRKRVVYSPVLSNWQMLIGAGVGCLSGIVSGHPIVMDGPVVTSPICAIEIASFAWARTTNRFYRLASPVGWTDSDTDGTCDPALFDGDHDDV